MYFACLIGMTQMNHIPENTSPNDIFRIEHFADDVKHKILTFYSDEYAMSVIIMNRINRLSEKMKGLVELENFEMKKDISVFESTKISVVPTILFIKDNVLIDYCMDLVSKNELKEKIERFIK